MSMKRVFVIALVLVLGVAANACRRIVDLTPFRDSALNGDAGLDTTFGSDAELGDAGIPGDAGHD
jgi:hypothetical protein